MAASAQPGTRARVRGLIQNLSIILIALAAVVAVYWYFFLREPASVELSNQLPVTQVEPAPTQRIIEPNLVIFQDTFEVARESWGGAIAGQAEIDRGAMILNDLPYAERGPLNLTNEPFEGEAFARPHLVFDNFILNVHTRWLSGAVGGQHGVRFRLQDEANFYAFYLSNEGRYTIGKMVNGEWAEGGSAFSDAISLGGGINLIQVEADGPTLRFFVNGTYIADMVDNSFGGGDIALIAQRTGETDSYIVAFDNLTVGRLAE